MTFDFDRQHRRMRKRMARIILLKLRDMQRGKPAKRTRRMPKEMRAEKSRLLAAKRELEKQLGYRSRTTK
jgi:hypothetical protein